MPKASQQTETCNAFASCSTLAMFGKQHKARGGSGLLPVTEEQRGDAPQIVTKPTEPVLLGAL